VKIVDVDEDGHLDLVLAISGDESPKAESYPGLKYSRIVFGDGSGKWTADRVVELPTNRWQYDTYATDLQVVDYDGDGDNDILTVLAYNTTPGGPGAVWRGQFLQVLRNEDGAFVDVTDSAVFGQGIDHSKVSNPFVLQTPDLMGTGRLISSFSIRILGCSITTSRRGNP
jgi:hypothetical protein